MMLRTGWRAQRSASPGRGTLPELLSLTTAAALAAFFLSCTSAFAQATATTVFHNIPEGAPGHLDAELPVTAALAAYLVTTAVIAVTLLMSFAAGRPPPRQRHRARRSRSPSPTPFAARDPVVRRRHPHRAHRRRTDAASHHPTRIRRRSAVIASTARL